ncbi:MAG: triose-phosphate isomerase [Christensenellales bacterium]|jgi:triosephosphate isomerase
MRKPVIAGNWKMNKTPSEAAALIEELKPLVKDAGCEVVVCVPFTCIAEAKKALEGSHIGLGAQNMHWEESGAFTGEISPVMLVDAGVQYVILGHSERRQYFAETDETVNKKMISALGHGLTPIVCVGETLAQREEGITESLVRGQTRAAYAGISGEDAVKTIIAYEPIWAIGTGKTATSDDANHVIGIIRDELAKIYGGDTAQQVRIQYGGSMNPGNASELMAMPEIDGGLIGGASLTADFSKVVNY